MIFMRLIWLQLRSFPLEYDLRTYANIESFAAERTEGCMIPEGFQKDLRRSGLDTLDPKLGVLDWFASKAHLTWIGLGCKEAKFHPNVLMRFNQNLLIFTIFVAVLLGRFVTGGWLIPLVVGVVLLSRGRLIASIGFVTFQMLISTSLTVLVCTFVHYLRTGWRGSLLGFFLMVVATGLLEPGMLALGVAIPLLVLVWRIIGVFKQGQPEQDDFDSTSEGFFWIFWLKLREKLGLHRDLSLVTEALSRSGTALSPLEGPFSLWILSGGRWLRIGAWTFLSSLAVWVMGLWLYGNLSAAQSQLSVLVLQTKWLSYEQFSLWVTTALKSLDLDLYFAFSMILVGMISPRRGSLTGFPDVCLGVLTLLGLSVLTSFFYDGLDYAYLRDMGLEYLFDAQSRSKRVILWFEPVVLCLGVLGVLNIFKLIDRFILRKKFGLISRI